MKTLKTLLTFVTLAFCFTACEDDSVKAVLKTDVAPNALETPSKTSYVLTYETKADIMETFQWSPTDFGFQASVTYKVQMDIAGNNFANKITIATTTDLEAAVVVGPVNDQLLGLGLVPNTPTDVEIRIESSLHPDAEVVYSPSKTVSISVYATTFSPIYGMGAALKGWGPWPDNAVEWQSSEYKKYETVAYFTTGQAFRWFAQLDWGPTSYNYPYFTTVDPFFVNASDGDSNLKVAGASGWYKVGVNLNTKVVTVTAVSEPALYMMGSAVNGWGPWNDKEVKMTYLKPGLFVAEATFSAGAFRFFAQADWGPTSYNFPYFTTVAADFVNANDGDSNLSFIGTPGVRQLIVDLNAKTVTLAPKLYMMGDALNGWGPWNDKEVVMKYKSPGVFEATTTFTNGGAFRFFVQADWGPDSYNYPYFTSVAADFINANDGDKNFKYIGTTGSRKVTVYTELKIVELQ